MTLREIADSFPIALPDLVWAALAVSAVVVYFWALTDAATRAGSQWREVGMSKALWVLGLLTSPWVALFFYLVIARPRLTARPLPD